MAESVDALVSNTSGFTSIPVRPRVWVLRRRKLKNSLRFSFLLLVTRWFADKLNQALCYKNWFDMFFALFHQAKSTLTYPIFCTCGENVGKI